MDGRGPGAGVRLAGPVGAPGETRGGWVGAAGAGADAAAAGACTGAGVGAAGAGVGVGMGVLGRGDGVPNPAGLGRIGPGVGATGRRVPIGGRLALGAGAACSLLEPPFDSFSFSRRSTGGSTVDEADRTNSPMSFNIVRTVLLSTPSSFASS